MPAESSTSDPLPPPDPLDRDGYHARQLELKKSAAPGNQRRPGYSLQPAYPWMLVASTALAGIFCYLYLTKPVITLESTVPSTTQNTTPTQEPSPEKVNPEPSTVESAEPRQLKTSNPSPYEETNLGIQHVLAASGPAGEDLGRITLNVPVLYESGQIRWSRKDIVAAQSLLQRINQHQQQAQQLREQAVGLISEWDELMIRTVPEPILRADSPTLPENQGSGSANAAPIRSTDAIKIDSE